MTTVLNITNTTGYNNWCPGHDHSVLNITKQQAMQIYVQAMTTVLDITKQQAIKNDVQAMTTVYSISPIQQAIKIGVQAMTTVYSISPNNRL